MGSYYKFMVLGSKGDSKVQKDCEVLGLQALTKYKEKEQAVGRK